MIDGDPCSIIENEFVKPGKGQAFNRVKFRNLKTGRVLERMVEDLFKRTIEPCKIAIEDAGLKVSEINDVIQLAVVKSPLLSHSRYVHSFPSIFCAPLLRTCIQGIRLCTSSGLLWTSTIILWLNKLKL